MQGNTATFYPAAWNLPEAIRARLGDQVGKQRAMDEEGHLLLILHEPPHASDNEVRKPALFWRNPAGEWITTGRGEGGAALENHLRACQMRIQQLDGAVDTARSPRQYFEVIREGYPLLRSTRSLLAALQEARTAQPDERILILARDRAVDLERAIDLVVTDARNGMEFSLAEAGEIQAREAQAATLEARRLNRLVGFFFPLATLAAILGMNEPIRMMAVPGFWLVVALGVSAGLILGSLLRMRN